jgi:nucleoid-associated protein YgaU
MVLLMVALFLGGQPLFAQYTLPEPVFEPAAGTVAEQPAPGGGAAQSFWLPDFAGIVYYLWDTAPEGAGGAQSSGYEFDSLAVLAAAADSDAGGFIPRNIRNNQYFIESVRLTNLAQESYESGDYDASTVYAEEAVRYARLSDEYVTIQLKIKEVNDTIAAAKARLDYAASIGAAGRYPAEYDEARDAYNASLSLRSVEDWDGAIAAAGRVINALAYIQPPADPPKPQPSVVERESIPLPAQYTVRAWAVSKDCLWNIAGRPWAYGDPAKWRLIYNANRSRMPQPDNPDLIHPGMVLDIPSIRGELRQGMWDAGRAYTPLP